MLNITIGFLQNVSLVAFLPVPWPVYFTWFKWLTTIVQVFMADLKFLERMLLER